MMTAAARADVPAEIAGVLAGADRYAIVHGSARRVLAGLPDGCMDAIVTDPPAGINFMQKEFDYDHGGREGWVRTFAAIFTECLRVLRPGGRALVWSIPRTSHWTACAVEDAGFIIENTIGHVYGQGFPKGKSQLKPSVEWWVLARKPGGKVPALNIDECRVGSGPISYLSTSVVGGGRERECNVYDRGDGKTPDGRDLAKIVARQRRYRENATTKTVHGRWPSNLVLSHLEGCRLAGEKRVKKPGGNGDASATRRYADSAVPFTSPDNEMPRVSHYNPDGLETVADWDCQPGCPVRLMGEQSGELTSNSGRIESTAGAGYRGGGHALGPRDFYGDTGTAARFFPQFPAETEAPPFVYMAKASRRDRNAGCEGLPDKKGARAAYGETGVRRCLGCDRTMQVRSPGVVSECVCGSMEWEWGKARNDGSGTDRCAIRANHHPTVKSTALMRWLVRLITPPGGIVLDPFFGSGSTGRGALLEGRRCIGIELNSEYVQIARARVADAARQAPQAAPVKVGTPPAATAPSKPPARAAAQLSLF